jgi:hypothetical protein
MVPTSRAVRLYARHVQSTHKTYAHARNIFILSLEWPRPSTFSICPCAFNSLNLCFFAAVSISRVRRGLQTKSNPELTQDLQDDEAVKISAASKNFRRLKFLGQVSRANRCGDQALSPFQLFRADACAAMKGERGKSPDGEAKRRRGVWRAPMSTPHAFLIRAVTSSCQAQPPAGGGARPCRPALVPL